MPGYMLDKIEEAGLTYIPRDGTKDEDIVQQRD